MNKKLLAALALALPFSASADILGVTAGVYNWSQNFSGDLRSEQTGSDEIDLEDDLNFDDDSANVFFVALEHPIPVLPNIRIGSTGIEVKETGTVSRTFNYEGQTYNQGQQVTSDIDLSHVDATLYYEILDNFVSLDVGLTARKFDGEATISDGQKSASSEIEGTLPLLYANARVSLPFLPGLYASGELHGIGYSGNSLIDTKIGLGYEIMGIVGLELGMRSFVLDLEGDDDEEFNMTVDGAFIGVVVDL
ncbi:TIGR04219 family outer membrane beta-barrel protein [Litorivivens sp.]|uniref:TIGR04219 family outer membrane beta-barrel protein n=1 Tax=Litorivivens sp. TaxID=2020868 RepID=UPI003564EFBF